MIEFGAADVVEVGWCGVVGLEGRGSLWLMVVDWKFTPCMVELVGNWFVTLVLGDGRTFCVVLGVQVLVGGSVSWLGMRLLSVLWVVT